MRERDIPRYGQVLTKASVMLTAATVLERQGITDIMPDYMDLILMNLSFGASLASVYYSRERFLDASGEKRVIDAMFQKDPDFYGSLISAFVNVVNVVVNGTYIATSFY